MKSEVPYAVSLKSGKDNIDDSSQVNSFYIDVQLDMQSRVSKSNAPSKIEHPRMNLHEPDTLPKNLKVHSPFSPST